MPHFRPGAGPTAMHPDRATPGLRPLPLAAAVAIMVAVTLRPQLLADSTSGADHWAATALFWAMSAGFVTGVGFRPHARPWRLLFSGSACLLGIGLAMLRLWA